MKVLHHDCPKGKPGVKKKKTRSKGKPEVKKKKMNKKITQSRLLY